MKSALKKISIVILLFALLVATLAACDRLPDEPTPDEPSVTPLASVVSFAPIPDGVDTYTNAQVFAGQTQLPVYNVKVNNYHMWSANNAARDDCGVAYFSLKGKVTLTVQCDGMQSCIVRPLSSGVSVACSDNRATFTLVSAGNYAIEPNGDATRAIFLFVSDGNESAPTASTTNVIHFAKGVHTAQNSEFINDNNVVDLPSNTTVILDEGAVVRAKFHAYQKDNVTICGRGIIDGSVFPRDTATGQVTVPLDFNYCTNVTFSDFSVLDPAGWCVNWYFCSNSTIDGVKIISSRANGDGISLQSCKNIVVKNCFVRSWDDSLVVKNYPRWSDRTQQGSTENILFEDITIWTDLAQSMEIGYETVGKTMKDITFRRITVLHNFHKPILSIHNSNNADVQNVLYDGITVEDAQMGLGDAGGNNQVIEIAAEYSSTWSNVQATTELGSVSNVTVKDLTVLGGNAVLPIRVVGSIDPRNGYDNQPHLVTGVSLQNVWFNGRKLTANYGYLFANAYAQVEVLSGDKPFTVPFVFSQTTEQLATYGDKLEVKQI